MSTKKYDEMVKLFKTSLSIVKICKKLGCHENTLKKVWYENYDASCVKSRINRVGNNNKRNNYCSIFVKDPEKYKKIVNLFISDKSVNHIGELLSVSPATVSSIWKKVFGEKSFNKRKIKVRRNIPNKHIGSKNEILCYNILKSLYKYTIHHDYSIVKGLEIDISIPDIKVAINWDGIVHRKPIYGEKRLISVKNNDNIKIDTLKKLNWTHIIVEDNGSYNPEFVRQKVVDIQEIIKRNYGGIYHVN